MTSTSGPERNIFAALVKDLGICRGQHTTHDSRILLRLVCSRGQKQDAGVAIGLLSEMNSSALRHISSQSKIELGCSAADVTIPAVTLYLPLSQEFIANTNFETAIDPI